MADEQTIVVQRPDGRYSRIPVSSLKDAVARGYTYAPEAGKPATGMKTDSGLATIPSRVANRIGDIAEGTEQVIPTLLQRSREGMKAGMA